MNRLPTVDCRLHMNQEIKPKCALCHTEMESVNNLMVHCSGTKQIWNSFPMALKNPTHFQGYSKWFWLRPSMNSLILGIHVSGTFGK